MTDKLCIPITEPRDIAHFIKFGYVNINTENGIMRADADNSLVSTESVERIEQQAVANEISAYEYLERQYPGLKEDKSTQSSARTLEHDMKTALADVGVKDYRYDITDNGNTFTMYLVNRLGDGFFIYSRSRPAHPDYPEVVESNTQTIEQFAQHVLTHMLAPNAENLQTLQ